MNYLSWRGQWDYPLNYSLGGSLPVAVLRRAVPPGVAVHLRLPIEMPGRRQSGIHFLFFFGNSFSFFGNSFSFPPLEYRCRDATCRHVCGGGGGDMGVKQHAYRSAPEEHDATITTGISIYTYIYVYLYLYVHMFTHKERETERESHSHCRKVTSDCNVIKQIFCKYTDKPTHARYTHTTRR